MLEVLKPPAQGPVQILADPLHTASVRSSGLSADGVLELVEAFAPRPFHSPFKMIAQKGRCFIDGSAACALMVL